MIRCSACGSENPEGINYCGACGRSLKQRCSRCEAENPPSFRFCGNCGAPLSLRVQAVDGDVPEAERRQLTVMFCDLVGSTALSLQLDPEELREVVRAYQEASVRVVERFEGYVAQYLGDGLLVYFGYPAAHEDEAERAVRAGLGILDAIERLGRRLKEERGIDLAVRIGVHTGLVVVGAMGGGARREHLAMGDTPNIAARLQGFARPGTLVVSDATCRLVARRFVYENLGRPALKGLAGATSVYQVIRERDIESALDLFDEGRLAAPVGREQEGTLLRKCWERVVQGSGQVVWIGGEAGIGKSYLTQAFKQHLDGRKHGCMECRCSPYHENSAFYPVFDLLQRILSFYPEESPRERLDMLVFMLERNGFVLPETVPLFADLLSVPLDDRYAPLHLAPQVQKERTQDALLQLFVNMAQERPLALFFEDLHWADPSTLELLGLLIDQGAAARLLILLTYRPVFHPPWPVHEHVHRILLGRLPRPDVVRLIEQVTGGKALPAEVMQQIVVKTDGVPLFVEELTKMVLESGLLREEAAAYELYGPLPSLSIPATLHDSLMARLDRLATVKEVAQLGACLGREFRYDLLRAVSTLEEDALQDALARLVDAELLYQEGTPPRAAYLFKHALIRDTAYQSLLKSTRQHFHQRIARQLDAAFPETVETQPELMAHHYEEAGLDAEAVSYWRRAGQRAVERSANLEAIAHLNRGLALLKTLPETDERFRQELDLQIALGTALVVTRGYAGPEIGLVFSRALALCRRLGEEEHLFRILFGQFATHFVRTEWRTAHTLAGQLLELAEGAHDGHLPVAAHLAMGSTLFSLGALTEALDHLEQAMARYDVERHRPLAVQYGQDLGVVTLCYTAFVRWALGYPDQALQKSREALALAQEIGHPHSLALARSFACSVRYFRREAEAVAGQAAALYTLSKEEAFQHWLIDGMRFGSWALAVQGEKEEAARRVDEAEAAYAASGLDLTLPYHHVMLAEIYGLVDEPGKGLALLETAFEGLEARGEPWWHEPELHRVRGALLLRHGAAGAEAEAEACFRRAFAVSRRLKAQSLALRALVSLGCLLQQQHRVGEIRPALEDCYRSFTEGYDTADMKEARALLQDGA